MIHPYYQNIDLDKCDKQQLNQIIEKIKTNDCLLDIKVKDSSSKGYHILMICNKKCDICRFVFDDAKRYEIDLGREERFKNVIFDNKEWFKGNMKTLSEKCERCAKYDINSTLTHKELTIQEIKKKMKTGKIKGYPPSFIYLGYVYFECPICHWFKFVKKKNIPHAKVDGYEKQ